MEWQFIVALVLAIPIILFPAAFVWYLNIGGIFTAIKEARTRRAARKEGTEVIAGVREQPVHKYPIRTNIKRRKAKWNGS